MASFSTSLHKETQLLSHFVSLTVVDLKKNMNSLNSDVSAMIAMLSANATYIIRFGACILSEMIRHKFGMFRKIIQPFTAVSTIRPTDM